MEKDKEFVHTKEAYKAEFKRIFNILNGKEAADLLITNVRILDVFQERVTPGSILVDKGKILALDPSEALTARETFDGQGMIAIPGLIDAHFHIESQYATPGAMQDLIVPHGTTAVFAEMLDIVAAAKEKGVEAAKGVFKDYDKMSYRLFLFAPGKKVELNIVEELLDWEAVVGLGELNHNLFLAGREEEFEKLAIANARNLLINGHVAYNDNNDLANLFPAMGTTNDHDVFSYEETNRSLRNGLPIQVREGLGCLEPILPSILNDHLPTDLVTLSTDNYSVQNLMKNGHMDFVTQKAIGMGVSPITAIKMASYNVARSFNMQDKLGSLAPGRYADIVLIERLDRIDPVYVFKGGELVAEKGQLLKKREVDYSDVKTSTKPGLEGLLEEDLQLEPVEWSEDRTRAKVTVWNQQLTGYDEYGEKWLDVREGQLVPELDGQPLNRVSLIERYPAEGTERKIFNAYITGYPLESGAVGIIMPSPAQYVGVIGKTTADLYFIARQLDRHSGAYLCTEGGQIQAGLELPIYSLMTDLGAVELVARLGELSKAAQALGYAPYGMPWFVKMNFLFWGLDRRGLFG